MSPVLFNPLNRNRVFTASFKLIKSKRFVNNIKFFDSFYKCKSINIKSTGTDIDFREVFILISYVNKVNKIQINLY